MAHIGRNEPCWCGSGLKYKKCHLNREHQQAVNPWEAEKALRKAFSTKDCLVPSEYKPQCSGGIVQAHSVAKCWLQAIARNSHVYGFKPSVHTLHSNFGKVKPELIGINNASTFTGFCSSHDKSIFSKIEDHQFEGTAEQCFLLAYRALSREYFTKCSAYSYIDQMRHYDRGKSESRQIEFQTLLRSHEVGTQAGLNDIKAHKSTFETILTSADYSELQYYIIEIDQTPEVLSSGGVFISYDFNGNRLQDLNDLETLPDSLYYSVIPAHKGGAIVFCWHRNSASSCHRFVRSIQAMDQGDIPNSIIQFLFEFCENNYASPSWWDNLDPAEKERVLDRFNKAMNPFEKRGNNCLVNDGLSVVSWNISNISSNVKLS